MPDPASAAATAAAKAAAKLASVAKSAGRRKAADVATNPENWKRLVTAWLASAGFITAAIVAAAAVAGSAGASQPGGWPSEVPEEYRQIYEDAGLRFRVNPYLLASIHSQETGFSTNPAARSGWNECGAAGPMQFGIVGVAPYDGTVAFCDGNPAGAGPTWDTYKRAAFRPAASGEDDLGVNRLDDLRPDSYPLDRRRLEGCRAVPSDVGCVYDDFDAIAAAAQKLRADGADESLTSAGTRAAVGWYVGSAHADYVDEVLTRAQAWEAAGGPIGGRACNVRGAVKVYEPARDAVIPRAYVSPYHLPPDPIDARLLSNVVCIARRYHLLITAGKELGHKSHGDGTAIDAIPKGDTSSQAVWDRTVGRLAADLGWNRACGASGSRPVCPLVPAVEFIGYDGFPSHGSPATCNGICPRHIHISWVSETHGTPYLTTPDWVLAFPRTGGSQ